MKKDVIYIDVDDDITAIIGKVKDAQSKIIAVVPPKRIGVLQSAVNLRLINRAAEKAHKRLVLITNNEALVGLAANAMIPVAKNLQSKPELPEVIPGDDESENTIIDGRELPVGMHVDLSDKEDEASEISKTVDEIQRTNSRNALGGAAVGATAMPRPKRGIKVPNFASTRKRLALIVGGGLLFIIFLIWAIFFAANARIIITARTTASGLSEKVILGDTQKTDALAKTLKTTTKQYKKDVSVAITPTGKKDLGTKASGTVTFTHCGPNDIVVPAGTAVSASGKNYLTANAVTVEPSSTRYGNCEGNYPTSVTVTAQENGDQYNIGPQSYQVAGQPSMSARGSQMAGGTSKIATVATAQDIQTAIDKATQETNGDAAKKALREQMGDGVVVIDQSFKADTSGVKSNVEADKDMGDTKPAVAGPAVYTMLGVEKNEMNTYLNAHFNKEIDGTPNQRIYSNGLDKVNFTNINISDKEMNATLSANGKIGPKIDEAAIKQFARGKEYGEIQSHIEAINGVDDVDVKFSPFWVSRAPDDASKVKIEFKLNES